MSHTREKCFTLTAVSPAAAAAAAADGSAAAGFAPATRRRPLSSDAYRPGRRLAGSTLLTISPRARRSWCVQQPVSATPRRLTRATAGFGRAAADPERRAAGERPAPTPHITVILQLCDTIAAAGDVRRPPQRADSSLSPTHHFRRRRRRAHALEIHRRSALVFDAPFLELLRLCSRAAVVAFDPVFHADAQIST